MLRDATGGTDARIDARAFGSTEQVQWMRDAFQAAPATRRPNCANLLMDQGSARTSPEVDDLMKEVAVDSEDRIIYDAFNDMLVTGCSHGPAACTRGTVP